jgi:hypothetical protein
MQKENVIIAGMAIIVLCVIITAFWVTSSMSSITKELKKLEEEYNSTSYEIAELRKEITAFVYIAKNPILVNVSELVSNPDVYQGKLVAVVGELHVVFTIPEVSLPYNFMVVSEGFQVGVDVKTNFEGLKGSEVLVIGYLVKGTKKTLSMNGLVNAETVWYIEATEVRKL